MIMGEGSLAPKRVVCEEQSALCCQQVKIDCLRREITMGGIIMERMRMGVVHERVSVDRREDCLSHGHGVLGRWRVVKIMILVKRSEDQALKIGVEEPSG